MSIISDISANQAAAARSSTTNANSAQVGLSGNFNTFLTLLTTQLRNQSPLDPMNTDQFTQQLTQFSQVEQQIQSNSLLQQIVSGQSATAASAAIGLLGTSVVASGTAATLGANGAQWTLNSPSAANATITVKNANGQVVHTEQRVLGSGAQAYTWNGRDDNGVVQAAGSYTIAITATNSANQPVTVSTAAQGRVTAIDFSGHEPILTVGDQRIPLSQVTSVTAAQ